MFKLTLKHIKLLFIIGFSVTLMSCTPVCCAPPYKLPEKPENLKRMDVRMNLLDAYQKKDFIKVRNMYAAETRAKFTPPSNNKDEKVTNKEVKEFVDGMNEFEFNKEVKLSNTSWDLVYNHTIRKNQYLIYTIVLEDNAYKILVDRFALK